MNIVNIANIKPNNRSYNGNAKKYGITVNGVDYIVKFTKDGDLSVYCEYAASNFIQRLGIPCHTVFLGTNGYEYVDIIRDFTSGRNVSLHSYKDTKQSSEDTDISNKEYTYRDVTYLIEKHLKMTKEAKTDALHRFWQMFICDAILGNKDRHWGNWGYLIDGNKSSLNYSMAPLYDNGASLFPGINKVIEQYINIKTRKQFVNDRIFTFPASLFKIKMPDRPYRSNYYKMFGNLSINKIFEEEVHKIRNAFTYQQIFYIIFDICKDLPLNIWYKRFFIEIVTLRYMCIVLRLDFDKSYNLLEEELNKYEIK